jgi:hypothetical protein
MPDAIASGDRMRAPELLANETILHYWQLDYLKYTTVGQLFTEAVTLDPTLKVHA